MWSFKLAFFFFLYSIVFSRFIHDACTSILNCQKIFHCEDYTTFCLSSSLPGSASCKEPACQCRRHKEMQVQSLSWEDPLEEEMAAHPSILSWRIPWREEPGGLQSMGSWRVGHDWAVLFRYRVSAGEDAKLLEMNGGDVITIMWKFLMPLNVHLKMIKMINCMECIFYHDKKSTKKRQLIIFLIDTKKKDSSAIQ